jgi:hypothetical protein
VLLKANVTSVVDITTIRVQPGFSVTIGGFQIASAGLTFIDSTHVRVSVLMGGAQRQLNVK